MKRTAILVLVLGGCVVEQDVSSVRQSLDAYCEAKIPPHVRDRLRLIHRRRGLAITLIQTRPPWDGRGDAWTELPVARLRFDPSTACWTLRYFDQNARSHVYEAAPPARRIETLLDAVDEDPTGIFWG